MRLLFTLLRDMLPCFRRRRSMKSIVRDVRRSRMSMPHMSVPWLSTARLQYLLNSIGRRHIKGKRLTLRDCSNIFLKDQRREKREQESENAEISRYSSSCSTTNFSTMRKRKWRKKARKKLNLLNWQRRREDRRSKTLQHPKSGQPQLPQLPNTRNPLK